MHSSNPWCSRADCTYKAPQFGLVTFPGLKSHTWLVASCWTAHRQNDLRPLCSEFKAYLACLFMPLVFKSKELCLAIISWAWDLWVSGILLSLHSTKNLSHPSICRTGLLRSQQKRYSSFSAPSLRHTLCNSLAPKLFQHSLHSHSLLSLSP